LLQHSDHHAEVVERTSRSLALAHRLGDHRWESRIRTGSILSLFMVGAWDEALVVAAEEEPNVATAGRSDILHSAFVHCERGDLERAQEILAHSSELRDAANSEARTAYALLDAHLLRAEGRHAEALAVVERILADRDELGITHGTVKSAVIEAVESALALDDLDRATELLAIPEALDPGELTPSLRANADRLRARLDAARGEDEQVDERFRAATALCREFGFVFYQALTQLEHAEWLIGRGRTGDAEAPLTEAGSIFQRLKARPWLDRVAAARAQDRAEAPAL
jgi:ATP/maltotriose-dependent transcriptional regulator MalT